MCEYDSKLISLVVGDTPKAVLGLIIVSVIFIWTYFNYIPIEYMSIWILVQSMFIISRYLNGRFLRRSLEAESATKIRFHTFVFGVIVTLSALIWSGGTLLGFIFAPSPYEFVALGMIMGIITAAVLSLTPIFNVFLVYFFIMIVTQFGIALYAGTHAHIAVAVFLLVYMPSIIILSKSIYTNHLKMISANDILESHVHELRELSITDSLTKVYNRRHFFEASEILISISKREKDEVSFLMIDIDFFKNVNDTYGHQIGDYVLVQIATKIKNILRESDIFARVGGEEFAVVLHNTSLEGAKIIAEKIRRTVEKMKFDDNYIPEAITVSIGTSSLNGKLTTLEELYQEADKKLYIAKELGRNRVQ